MNDTNNSLYSLEYDKETKIGTLILHIPLSSEQYRPVHEHLAEFIEKHALPKLIYSMHYSHVILAEDRQWANEVLVPRIFKAGLRFAAIVVPQNPKTQKIVEAVVNKIDQDAIQTQYFYTVLRGKGWIKNLQLPCNEQNAVTTVERN